MGCWRFYNGVFVHINPIGLMNRGLYNPGRQEGRHHLSIRSRVSALMYPLPVLGAFTGLSGGVTCGLFCSGPGCALAQSLGKRRGCSPLAPASLEPD